MFLIASLGSLQAETYPLLSPRGTVRFISLPHFTDRSYVYREMLHPGSYWCNSTMLKGNSVLPESTCLVSSVYGSLCLSAIQPVVTVISIPNLYISEIIKSSRPMHSHALVIKCIVSFLQCTTDLRWCSVTASCHYYR